MNTGLPCNPGNPAEPSDAAQPSNADPAAGTGGGRPGWRSFFRRVRTPVIIYLVCTGAYLGTAAGRLKEHSYANHYVYLADSWLHGTLAVRGKPPHDEDWSRVEVITLRSGERLEGVSQVGGLPDRFRTLSGKVRVVPEANIAKREDRHFVSFPPLPAVLMAPFVAIWGLRTNDVIFTCFLAGFGPALAYLVLRRLRRLKLSCRSQLDDLTLVFVLAFGSVFYFSAVLGQVWYTAHMLGVALSCLFVLASLEARHPILAGLCVGLALATRGPTLLVMGLFFVFEAVRMARPVGPGQGAGAVPRAGPWPTIGELFSSLFRRPVLRQLLLFALPVVSVGLILAVHNYLRFQSPFEFGHTYLNVKWAGRIQRYGLFNYSFLSRNLTAAFVLLPKLMNHKPFVQISWHGMSLFLTTPLLAYLLWPRIKGVLHRPLWLTTACVALPSFVYQNSGWVQYGYRFSLDYMIFLLMLLALGGRPLGWWARGLIFVGFAVSLFGAITFGRMWGFYYDGFFPVE